MIAILAVVLAVVLYLAVFASMTGTDTMPAACPACMNYGRFVQIYDDAPLPSNETWYVRIDAAHVRCSTCGKHFREHPNGTLVEDRG